MTRPTPTTKPTPPSLAEAFSEGFETGCAAIVRVAPPDLETFITSSEYCAFPSRAEGKPSDPQLALVRAIDGKPHGLDRGRGRFHFNVENPTVSPWRPTLFVIRGGVRAGKTLLATLAGIVYGALYCDVSVARPGEKIKALIVAPRLKQAEAPFAHAMGTLENSPRLSKNLIVRNAQNAIIRRDDGVEIEIALAAAAPGGTNLRGTWLAGCLFTEADFFDAEDAAVNLADNIRAVRPRMLPGAQVGVESSPWADTGPFHKLFTDHFGAAANGIIAFHSDSRSMFPGLEKDGEAQLRAADPDAATREYDAIPTSTSGTDFFPMAAIESSVNKSRPLHLEPVGQHPHFGGTDLAFRKNSSAIAFARWEQGKVRLAYHHELRPEPGRPLRPSEVCGEFARKGIQYFATSVRGDLHYADTAHEEFAKTSGAQGRRVTYDEWNPSQENQVAAFTEFRRLMLEGLLELPDDPRLRLMIEKTKSKPMPGGRISIVLPKQGWAHGDVLMAVVLACTQVPAFDPVSSEAWSSPIVDSRWGDGGRGY